MLWGGLFCGRGQQAGRLHMSRVLVRHPCCLIVWILPSWAGGIFFVVALIASDVLQSTAGHARFSGTNLLMLIILVIGLLVGLYFGRIRGLRHLGEYEFRNRWNYIRTISHWF